MEMLCDKSAWKQSKAKEINMRVHQIWKNPPIMLEMCWNKDRNEQQGHLWWYPWWHGYNYNWKKWVKAKMQMFKVVPLNSLNSQA